MKMNAKFKLISLVVAFSLVLVSCGSSSSKAKTACLDAIKKAQATYKKSAGKDMPEAQRKAQEEACAKL